MVLVGLVLACAPTLVHDPGPPADLFAAIERRIPFGGLAGIGALLASGARFRPWPVGVASLFAWVTGGLLIARLVGLALDGAGSAEQWMWVVVELFVLVGAVVFLRLKSPTAAASS